MSPPLLCSCGDHRLPAAGRGRDRPRGHAARRQRGRRGCHLRLRAGRDRSSDVRHRRLRSDARAQPEERRCAARVLRDRRRALSRGPVGAPVYPSGRGPLRLRAGRSGERRRLPIGCGSGHGGRAARGADSVWDHHVGAGDRAGHPTRTRRLSGHWVHARLLDDRLRARRRAEPRAHPGDCGRESHLYAKWRTIRYWRTIRAEGPRPHAGTVG